MFYEVANAEKSCVLVTEDQGCHCGKSRASLYKPFSECQTTAFFISEGFLCKCSIVHPAKMALIPESAARL